ncbi:hypothetical protein GF361_01800 [Candidatus Woesearchaeota archaeon]|nr:hypothetical protein [Candidatus Woesearchaeota archaeon]
MKKVVYSGSPLGMYSEKNWKNFLNRFEEAECIRSRKGNDYNYRIDHIISENITARYTYYKNRKLQIRKNDGSRIKVTVSGSKEGISDFEKIIEKAEKEY